MKKKRSYEKHEKLAVNTETEFNFGYFYRTIEDHINSFATEPGCPYSVTDITLRLAELLQTKALRETSWNTELVSKMWKNSIPVNSRTEVKSGINSRQETLHVRAHGHRTLSKKALRAIKLGQKLRWAKFHATQNTKTKSKKQKNKKEKRGSNIKSFWAKLTPEERSTEMKRRYAMRQKKGV